MTKKKKQDYVWAGDLKDAKRVMEQLPGWFEGYSECASHKGLKMRSQRLLLKNVI